MNVRLHITELCDRACPGCCMKQGQFKLEDVPSITSAQELPEGTELVLLTGGEPMKMPYRVEHVVREIEEHSPGTQVMVYTAGPQLWGSTLKVDHQDVRAFQDVASLVDGFTYTLHEPEDVPAFEELLRRGVFDPSLHSLRLNVFETVSVDDFAHLVPSELLLWDIRWNYVWIENCPLPKNEIFMRWDFTV